MLDWFVRCGERAICRHRRRGLVERGKEVVKLGLVSGMVVGNGYVFGGRRGRE